MVVTVKERSGYPSIMVKNKHDISGYDLANYQRDIYDGNLLYESFLKMKRGRTWKPQVQRFEMTYLLGLGKIQKELKNKTYQMNNTTNFVISERGKTRLITGECVSDRIVGHALCDEIINPSIKKYLIYDNGASQKGKGVSFTRKRLEKHLISYYRNNGCSNEGYILLIDFSKYYDNIRHDILKEMFFDIVRDEHARDIISKTLKRAEIDISFTEDDLSESIFDSLWYYNNIPKSMRNGTRFLKKHLDIGTQVSQSAGVLYRSKLDNYIKIVRGIKYYAAHVDDSYIIHSDKVFLKKFYLDISNKCDEYGIHINKKKTSIYKLSDGFRFLQIRYRLTDTGKIVKKINPKNVTRFRRKIKKLAHILSENEFDNLFKSWIGSNAKYMSKQQRKNMYKLYYDLKNQFYKINGVYVS